VKNSLNRLLCLVHVAALVLATVVAAGAEQPPSEAVLQNGLHALYQGISRLKAAAPSEKRVCDAEVYAHCAEWALTYDLPLSESDRRRCAVALEHGTARLAALSANPQQLPWAAQRGGLVRGYVSRVDGSVQPYGLIIPSGYRPGTPIRLDVVLHGSSHPTGTSEVRFIEGFDHASDRPSEAPVAPYIELHPLGRVENCYRWAGETDVFEAIEDVCRCYSIDRSRIVLRGMSMGASGTWHLGLKHPGYFAALGPYCGYVDTHQFSETPGMNFVKVGPLPEVQEMGLHMLDSVDYAANAGVVPEVAAIGEVDPFFQAHVIMRKAMAAEGLEMVNLISPNTAHVQDPKTWAKQMEMIRAIAERGRQPDMPHLRFVTWTLKYADCHWVTLLRLHKQYQRAEFVGDRDLQGNIRVSRADNIDALLLRFPARGRYAVTIEGRKLTVRAESGYGSPGAVATVHRNSDGWSAGKPANKAGKQPGQQGPIDDAFSAPFLCVIGTGTPWSATADSWAKKGLKQFQYEWSRYYRGTARVKRDVDVTREDCDNYNLILFGDPGSCSLIRRAVAGAAKRHQLCWTRNEITAGAQKWSAKDHVLQEILPSPFTKQKRYVVINSGHTFHEAELNRLNYLLYPHLGDYAVTLVGSDESKLELTGYYNEQWQLSGL
jgi:pimeloyl-ACP methyl ester carboxylesterase